MKIAYIYIVGIFLFSEVLFAQSDSNSFVRMNGQISFSYDNYSYNTTNYDNFRARYPDDLFRISANSTIYFGEYFRIPIGINFSNQKVSYYIPQLPAEGLANYVQSPRNNFHINPTYKWARVNLGTNITRYSDLTTGNVRVFGVGFEVNPGKFIMSANYGISQVAVDANSQYHIQGAYQQKIMSARIGYGKIKGGKVTLNVVKVKDEINSVSTKPVGVTPIEGISFAPLIEVHLTKSITLKTETGISLTTKDLLAKNDIINYENEFMTINNSTITDFAHISSINWKGKKVRLGGEFRYVGPGYLFAGYRNTETDIIDYKLLSGFTLFKSKLNINAVVGVRTNNIRNTKISKNNRFIGNINVFAQLTKAFSINAGYNNFGFRNNTYDPMLRVEMVNNSISFTPTYQIKSKTKMHQISMMTNINRFKQYDFYKEAFVNSESNSYNASYTINFLKKSIILGTNILYLENKSDYINLKMINYSVHGSYRFFKKALQTNLYATLSNYKRDNFSADYKINIRLKFNYKVTKKMNASLSYSLNNNQYGSLRPGAISNENKIRFMLTQKF